MTKLVDELMQAGPVDYARARWREWQAHPTEALGIQEPGTNTRFDTSVDESWDKLEAAARDPALPLEPLDYDVLMETAVHYLRDIHLIGQLPRPLALFLADVLERKRKRPAKPGPSKDAKWLRDVALRKVTRDVARHYGLPLYLHNDAYTDEDTERLTAAGVVSEATGIAIETIIKACQ